MLADFDRRIAALNEITSSIVIVGMNASLKATRLGPAGRSLVVVSEELRRLALAIANDSEELCRCSGAFGTVRPASVDLSAPERVRSDVHRRRCPVDRP